MLAHVFVKNIPERLEKRTLYISIEYNTAAHLCCCGCDREVITPLSPKDWKMIYNGKTVSLHPSIGNWSFPCRSHYWIRDSEIVWAENWSDEKVTRARQHANFEKTGQNDQRGENGTFWSKITDWFF